MKNEMIEFKKGDDLKLSEYFRSTEFECPCGECTHQMISQNLIDALTIARTLMQEPIRITSGYRCVTHNLNAGGATDSQHIKGLAADFRTTSRKNLEKLYSICLIIPGVGGLGRYIFESGELARLHMDFRVTARRHEWTKMA